MAMALALTAITPGVQAAPAAPAAPAAHASDAALLRAHLRQTYPSLEYVQRQRALFPDEAQGAALAWREGGADPPMATEREVVEALAQLGDQHVALVGPRAGKAETLGVLFRSASDGSLVAWRVFGAAARRAHLQPGERVLAVDGVATASWLRRSAARTFGGNRRGRMAEAALDLGLGTPLVHRVAGLQHRVALRLRDARGSERTLALAYAPVDEALATAMAAAIGRPDLPAHFAAAGLRVGTLRLGAFAPQYDPRFIEASEKAADLPGTNDDDAMLAGYCAVVADFVAHADAVAADSDLLLLDLRGNLGGFDREAGLLVQSLAAQPIAPTWDWFPTDKPGRALLKEEIIDPPCAHIATQRPLLVLTDAGTRSAGEFSTAWLWQAGAFVLGETTAGAGGGYEYQHAPDFELPGTGLRVRASANFSLFDPTTALHAGEFGEDELVALASADGFLPSRARPFAIQSVGFRPDLPLDSTFADLRDGGRAQLRRAIARLRATQALPLDPGTASRD
jgi:C-terminal processing protease CtpA/Prc